MRTEDGHIIQQCLDGDHVAFGMLVDKYKRSVYAIAFSRLRNYHDAQDITQEAFIKAYQNLHTLRRWDNFMGWLYRVTNNLCKDWLRLKARRVDKDYMEDQKANTLDQISMDSYEENALYESINDSLESLPDIYQEILSLRYFGGMNIHEISVFLGMSTRTIDRRLKEAMSRLKEETLAMMTAAKEQEELPGSFTFHILELIKHLRVNPSPSIRMIPWGISLATGLLVAILGFGMRFDNTNILYYARTSSSAGEPAILDVGELPVEVVKVSDVSIISDQQLPGNGLDAVFPDPQNALALAPQAEGGTWTKKADMPTARTASSCAINGKIYVIGGSPNDKDVFHTVEEYDPATDKWTKKADMPTARSGLSVCEANGKIYAIGGWLAGWPVSNIVEEYDPITDKWTRKADMPTARSCLAACSVNGKIYAIGGWNRSDVLSTVEEYDPLKDEWTKKSDMPTARDRFTASVVDGRIYAIGGTNRGTKCFSVVEEYDPSTDKWTTKANMPSERGAMSSSVVNGKIYVAGGSTFELAVLSLVEEYDPSKDEWVRKSDMITKRVFLSSDTVNGKIYAIGGLAWDGQPVKTVEEYTPGASNENNKSIDLKGKLPTTWGDVRTAMNK